MNKHTESGIKRYPRFLRRLLAKFWLEVNLQLTVVGVTGSYGKTTAVSAIAKVLLQKYSVNKTDLNLDTIYNLPLTILKTKIWNEILVLEYGVDRLHEMDFHLSLVKPKIAIFTGITSVHTDDEHFGSLENAIAEKKKLVDSIPDDGLGVFNYDDESTRKVGLEFKKRKVFYGLNRRADIWAEKVEISFQGTEFVLHEGGEELKVKTGLLGYPAVYGCLVAYIVGRELKVGRDRILAGLKTLEPLEGRFSIEEGPLQTILVNDCKRANFASTATGLKSLAEFPGRKVAVIGEMGEIGKAEEEIHRKIGLELARSKIDIVVGVGPLTKLIIDEARREGKKKPQLFWTADVVQAAEVLRRLLKKGDIFYLKSSLLRHLERIPLILREKEMSCRKIICHYYGSCTSCPNLNKKI